MISFLDFLKKYSTIPNQFLDDFFKLFNNQSIDDTEKIIDLENVAKWLEVQKQCWKVRVFNKIILFIILLKTLTFQHCVQRCKN
jgi:hypothetical protein